MDEEMKERLLSLAPLLPILATVVYFLIIVFVKR